MRIKLKREQMVTTLVLLGWRVYTYLGREGKCMLIKDRELVSVYADGSTKYHDLTGTTVPLRMDARRELDWSVVSTKEMFLVYHKVVGGARDVSAP